MFYNIFICVSVLLIYPSVSLQLEQNVTRIDLRQVYD